MFSCLYYVFISQGFRFAAFICAKRPWSGEVVNGKHWRIFQARPNRGFDSCIRGEIMKKTFGANLSSFKRLPVDNRAHTYYNPWPFPGGESEWGQGKKVIFPAVQLATSRVGNYTRLSDLFSSAEGADHAYLLTLILLLRRSIYVWSHI